MFVIKFALAAVFALSAAYVVGAAPTGPTGLSPREDWKTKLGWDGKVITPAELDPSNTVKPTPGKRAPAVVNGGVFFCTDPNFTGNCVNVNNFNSGQCVGVGPDFNDDVTSFGPDPGLTCTIFSDANCNGRATGGVVFPGINNLGDFNNNDAMSSFSCTQ